jgi:hypothetical protein
MSPQHLIGARTGEENMRATLVWGMLLVMMAKNPNNLFEI